MGKRRRRAGAAEADEGDEGGESSAVQTTMRPMEEEGRKAMSRKMMREKEWGIEIRRNELGRNLQILHRLSHPPAPVHRGLPFSHET